MMDQLTLFSAHGDLLKRHGQADIEATGQGFIAIMRRQAKVMSDRDGSVTTDALRMWAVGQGLYPKHPNSYGCIFKGKGWTILGYQKSAIPSNHSRPIAIWRWEHGR